MGVGNERHDRGVGDPQPGHAADAEVRVHDGTVV
jgi:hypothetical protein